MFVELCHVFADKYPTIIVDYFQWLISNFVHEARFCRAMDGVTHAQVMELAKTYPDEGLDLTDSAKKIAKQYISIEPKSKSEYFIVTHNHTGTHTHPIPTLKSN